MKYTVRLFGVVIGELEIDRTDELVFITGNSDVIELDETRNDPDARFLPEEDDKAFGFRA